MPTPFTHLEIAQRLLRDPQLSAVHRQQLHESLGAFLLGSIAADARVSGGTPRETTHFYAYGQPIEQHPWERMLTEWSALRQPRDAAHQAFVAGYVAHLAVDEYWSLNMVKPNFADRHWADRRRRFLMLHVILIVMDERDYTRLNPWQADALQHATPRQWLAFITDDDLCAWRDLIHRQITPDGQSETYDIFGERTGLGADALRSLMDTDDKLHTNLWQHIPQPVLAEVEAGMYVFARSQMSRYLSGSSVP